MIGQSYESASDNFHDTALVRRSLDDAFKWKTEREVRSFGARDKWKRREKVRRWERRRNERAQERRGQGAKGEREEDSDDRKTEKRWKWGGPGRVASFRRFRTYNANQSADAPWQGAHRDLAPPHLAYIFLTPQTGWDSQWPFHGVFSTIYEFPTGNLNSQWSFHIVILYISEFPIGNFSSQ